jgi:predicted nuclease with TOPRIM domain
MKQTTRSEIRENHINRLQEKYNDLYKDYQQLEQKYERLVYFAIQTVFDDFNDDVELLARYLYREGLIKRTETDYINPIKDNPNCSLLKEIEKLEGDK